MAAVGSAAPSTNAILAGLKRTTLWQSPTMTYAFADAGDSARMDAVYRQLIGRNPPSAFDPIDASDPAEAAFVDSVVNAFESFSRVTNISFTPVSDVVTADIVIAGGYGPLFQQVVAFMETPGSNLKDGATNDYQVHFFVDMGEPLYAQEAEIGGGSFNNFLLLHEFGHGLGLSHPHDADAGTTAWSDGTATSTDPALDNERYTVESYETGGINTQRINTAATGGFGHAVTFGALDIAAFQEAYGTRAAHTGVTNYIIADERTLALDTDGNDGTVAIGRAHYTIWDTGGTDQMTYIGASAAYLNLNDATLFDPGLTGGAGVPGHADLFGDLASTTGGLDRLRAAFQDTAGAGYNSAVDELVRGGGGGFVSSLALADGTRRAGGYTIANGVVIENASSGSGDDLLVGNEAANVLRGNGGDDIVAGWRGNDTLIGGSGNDALHGGEGDDTINGGVGTDTAHYRGAAADYTVVADATSGTVRISHIAGAREEGVDTLSGVETARFSDGAVTLPDVTATTAQFAAQAPVQGGGVFAPAQGWQDESLYPRMSADLDGDGNDDLVGFGFANGFHALGRGDGTFGPMVATALQFGVADGWQTNDAFHRTLADVDGDGAVDVVGFGYAGAIVARGDGAGGFGTPALALDSLGFTTGWTSQDRYPRQLGDVNGDGRADIVGFGENATLVSLARADGTFAAPVVGSALYGQSTGWSSQDQFPRQLGDVNGDGREDIVALGFAGVIVSLSNGDGTFGGPILASSEFGFNTGWSSQTAFPRMLADANGDGRIDIVGVGFNNYFVALGQADGRFGALQVTAQGANPRLDAGFTDQNATRTLTGDFNGDAIDDLATFVSQGVVTRLSTPASPQAFALADDGAAFADQGFVFIDGDTGPASGDPLTMAAPAVAPEASEPAPGLFAPAEEEALFSAFSFQADDGVPDVAAGPDNAGAVPAMVDDMPGPDRAGDDQGPHVPPSPPPAPDAGDGLFPFDDTLF